MIIIFDRHMVGCRYNDGVATNEVLEFQIYGGHLCAFCARCSFYEQIT